MEIKLHANATTTPRTRKYLQESTKSDRELAQELGQSLRIARLYSSQPVARIAEAVQGGRIAPLTPAPTASTTPTPSRARPAT